MQKKLIALAVAGLASTAAFAQSNVTIYGIMDASIDLVDIGDAGATNGRNETQINSNASRIGFKGSEDLGNGLKAIFQIETAIGADGTSLSAGSNNSRNTYVGLAGSWGQVLLGQYDTPYKTSTRKLDLFADHLGDTRNLMGWGGVTGFDIRQANTVRYDSPDMNGFAVSAAYAATSEGANAVSGTQNDRLISLSGTYTNGPWYGALAYQKNELGSGTGATAGDDERAWKLGVGYTQDVWHVGFAYENIDDNYAVPGSSMEHDAWTLGGSYTAGSNVFKLAYTEVDDTNNVSDTGAKQWAIGVDHILSKRTKLYAEYVKLSNDSAAAYTLNGAGTTATAGVAGLDADPSAFSFGIKHSF